MTDSYRSVYEHLASGSETLCQDPVSTPRLDFPQHTGLDTEAGILASDINIADTFSDAETDNAENMITEAIPGDAPRVPNLDKLHTERRPTHHTPSA